MPRSCCRTLVLVLVSLVCPVGAPVAIAFSRGCGVVLFVYAPDREEGGGGTWNTVLLIADRFWLLRW